MAFTNTSKNISRGALLGGALAFVIFGLWFFAAGSGSIVKGGAHGEQSDELSMLYVLIPVLTGLFCGAVLGYVADRAQIYRLPKLFGTAAGLYLCAAWICAASLVFATMLAENPDDPWSYAGEDGPLLDSLKFAFAGAIFLSPVCVPLVLLLVFGLERWTRRR